MKVISTLPKFAMPHSLKGGMLYAFKHALSKLFQLNTL